MAVIIFCNFPPGCVLAITYSAPRLINFAFVGRLNSKIIIPAFNYQGTYITLKLYIESLSTRAGEICVSHIRIWVIRNRKFLS